MSKSIEDVLTAIVGAKGIAVETEDKAPFLKERRGLYEGSCLAVVSPGTTEQVSEVVKYCFDNDIRHFCNDEIYRHNQDICSINCL